VDRLKPLVFLWREGGLEGGRDGVERKRGRKEQEGGPKVWEGELCLLALNSQLNSVK
jgi:hypothetical protein